MNKLIKVWLAVSCFCLSIISAHATLITSDLVINGSSEFSVADSNATFQSQTGTISQRIGGVDALTNINGLTPDNANPRGGQLTDINDGVGASFDVLSSLSGDNGDFIFDFAFDLTNNSLTDSFLVSFLIDFSNLANADGPDSFIDSEINFFNAGLTEFFASDLTSDTNFGDQKNGVGQGTSGAVLTDGTMFSFDVTLNANSSDSFTGGLKVDGGNFRLDSLINAQASAFVSVAGVRNITRPPNNQVPEPLSAILLLLSFLGFTYQRSVSQNK